MAARAKVILLNKNLILDPKTTKITKARVVKSLLWIKPQCYLEDLSCTLIFIIFPSLCAWPLTSVPNTLIFVYYYVDEKFYYTAEGEVPIVLAESSIGTAVVRTVPEAARSFAVLEQRDFSCECRAEKLDHAKNNCTQVKVETVGWCEEQY